MSSRSDARSEPGAEGLREWVANAANHPYRCALNRQFGDAEADALILAGRWNVCDCGLDVLAATPAADSRGLDPVVCAICGDYSAQGVEVHERCLAALTDPEPAP